MKTSYLTHEKTYPDVTNAIKAGPLSTRSNVKPLPPIVWAAIVTVLGTLLVLVALVLLRMRKLRG